jgi:hypothetical protein
MLNQEEVFGNRAIQSREEIVGKVWIDPNNTSRNQIGERKGIPLAYPKAEIVDLIALRQGANAYGLGELQKLCEGAIGGTVRLPCRVQNHGSGH